tara:strand:+ start:7809 stop:8060 length:252 start_codon:yes stop_codon:yes gene_type:complete
MKQKRTQAQQKRNNALKQEVIKIKCEKALAAKAVEELQQITSEKRQHPDVMWARLIEESGKEFENAIFKKYMDYKFDVVEKQS